MSTVLSSARVCNFVPIHHRYWTDMLTVFGSTSEVNNSGEVFAKPETGPPFLAPGSFGPGETESQESKTPNGRRIGPAARQDKTALRTRQTLRICTESSRPANWSIHGFLQVTEHRVCPPFSQRRASALLLEIWKHFPNLALKTCFFLDTTPLLSVVVKLTGQSYHRRTMEVVRPRRNPEISGSARESKGEGLPQEENVMLGAQAEGVISSSQ